jgi:hypothetical protein
MIKIIRRNVSGHGIYESGFLTQNLYLLPVEICEKLYVRDFNVLYYGVMGIKLIIYSGGKFTDTTADVASLILISFIRNIAMLLIYNR